MNDQNGRTFEDLAAESGAPQTRVEVESMLARASASDVTLFVKRWLVLDDELNQIMDQANHVEHVLGDRILGTVLGERVNDIISTMRRRARDLAKISSRQAEDVGAKCYVRSRICEIAPADETTPRQLCESLRTDVDALGIDVGKLARSSS